MGRSGNLDGAKIMSTKRTLLIVAIAAGSLTVGSQAMALNPQPLPPRWSNVANMNPSFQDGRGTSFLKTLKGPPGPSSLPPPAPWVNRARVQSGVFH
jgi:hypothetical protein